MQEGLLSLMQMVKTSEALDQFDTDVRHWPRVFPPTVHIEHEQLSESEERIQLWATANGAVKTWTSRRRLDAGARLLEENAQGVAVTSQHTIVIKPSAVASVLGAEATVADARNFVRTALSTNSLATLDHARSFAEHRSRERSPRAKQGS